MRRVIFASALAVACLVVVTFALPPRSILGLVLMLSVGAFWGQSVFFWHQEGSDEE